MEILSLGEKIKQRRKELDLTLKNLAGDRITAGQISLIESGKSNPSMDLLEYLASELKVSVEHLMETEETQANKICTYYENIAETYILSGNLEEGDKALEKSIPYMEKYNLEIKMARNLYLKALILEKKNEYEEAQELLLSANNIYVRYNCNEKVIRIFILLGKITLNLGAYHSAYSYFQQAEKVFEDSDVYNELLHGQVVYYISNTLSRMGLNEKAKEYIQKAEKRFEKIKSLKGYAESFVEIAIEKFQDEKLNQAINYTEKSLSFFHYRDERYDLAELMCGMGALFSEYDQIYKSFSYLENADKSSEMILNESILNSLILACSNYIKLKDEINANKILHQIEENIENNCKNNYKFVSKCNMLKYKIELLEKKHEQAEETLLNTFDILMKNGDLIKSSEIAITLSKFYIDLGNEEEARKHLDIGVELLKNESE